MGFMDTDKMFVCREGHWHDGTVLGRDGSDGEKCPEERVSDLVAKGVEYDEAVDKVYA